MATLFLLLLSLSPSWGQNITGEAEFQQKKEFLNSRFEDFFNRQQQIENVNEQREKAATEIGPTRIKEEKTKELLRQEYVRNRPKPADREADRIAHEKAQAEMAKQMNEYRKNYVQRQETLMKMFSKSRQVPPEYDSGLVNPDSN